MPFHCQVLALSAPTAPEQQAPLVLGAPQCSCTRPELQWLSPLIPVSASVAVSARHEPLPRPRAKSLPSSHAHTTEIAYVQDDTAPERAVPQDQSLLGKAKASGVAAAAAVSQTAADLNRKYAPAALGGTGADAAYQAPARVGAGAGADPSPAEVEGLHPPQGLPRDAPVGDAATGGAAAGIAGIAAAAAAGMPEGSSSSRAPHQVRCTRGCHKDAQQMQ